MKGIIESIKSYPAKGEAGNELAEARLIKDTGLEGDYHAKGGDRQLSLLLTDKPGKLPEQKSKGLCSNRFRENLLLTGLSPDALRPGQCLCAGDAVIEITGRKSCHDECDLYKAGKPCPLAGRCLFARVVTGGVVRRGDGVDLGEICIQ